jgi:hypothetical protein
MNDLPIEISQVLTKPSSVYVIYHQASKSDSQVSLSHPATQILLALGDNKLLKILPFSRMINDLLQDIPESDLN